MNDAPTPALRLAFRTEGDFVAAYLAEMATMDGALELGRMHRRVLENQPRWEAFEQLMRNAVSEIMQDTFGLGVDRFETQRAPEHERAGRA